METCRKCGGSVGSQEDPDPGLEFLQSVTASIDDDGEGPLCARCREERRVMGAALLNEWMPG